MKLNRLNSRGFSLVEMALVLVVVGIVIGIGAGMIGPLTTMSKTRESREILESDIASVSSWSASNNRLPTFTPTPPDTTRFDQIVRSPVDSWGRPLMYLYDANLAPSGSNVPTKDTICGRKTTAISITDTTVIPTVTTNNVAFVIISQGEDALTQTTLNGILNGVALNGVIAGSGAATGTITRDPTISDIIRWITLDELRSKVGCQGAQLRIVNNELPPATVASIYPNITLSIDGGATAASTYRWCIESIAATPLPTGLTFTTTTPALPIRVTPANTCASLPEASWGVVTASPYLLTISGTPAANMQGAYSFTLYVRDNNDTTGANDNITSKAFVLTVNP